MALEEESIGLYKKNVFNLCYSCKHANKEANEIDMTCYCGL